MEKNFVNYHIIISHSPSCLNRDDMNMQKSAVFGGKRRVRISSQSLKRTMRTSEYYKLHLGSPSIRTHHLSLLKDEFLKDDDLKAEFTEAIVKNALDRFVKSQRTTEDDGEQIDDRVAKSEKKLAVAPWIKEEFKVLCRAIKDAELTPEEEEKIKKEYEKNKSKKGTKSLEFFREQILAKRIDNGMAENKEALISAISFAKDVALSGRMATSGLMTTIDGALAVAHVITTHTVDADIDWFTAVDDLQELGSGHLDTQEFSSGVFYRYASLNIAQLQENLGNAPREKMLEIAAHVLHLIATVVPSAKQQSFAAHNLADLAMVSFSDIPVSLANAFEEPVKALPGGGFLKSSVDSFHSYWENVHSGYGLNEQCAEFSTRFSPPTGITIQKTLEGLKTWVRTDGRG